MSFLPSRRALNIDWPRSAYRCWNRWLASLIGRIVAMATSTPHAPVMTARPMTPHVRLLLLDRRRRLTAPTSKGDPLKPACRSLPACTRSKHRIDAFDARTRRPPQGGLRHDGSAYERRFGSVGCSASSSKHATATARADGSPRPILIRRDCHADTYPGHDHARARSAARSRRKRVRRKRRVVVDERFGADDHAYPDGR